MRKVFLAVFLLCAGASVLRADGGCYSRGRCYYPSYYNYYYPYYYDAVVVPKAVIVPFNVDYYSTVEVSSNYQLLADAIAYRLGNRTTVAAPAASQYATAAPQQQQQAPATAPAQEQQQAQPGANWKQQLQQVVSESCLKCHGGGSLQGGLSLANLDAVPIEKRMEAYTRVNIVGSTLSMPKDGRPLDEAKAQLFAIWWIEGKAAAKDGKLPPPTQKQ